MRFVNPASELRIAGGREMHLGALQPLGLFVANSIFIGDYLTTKGQAAEDDYRMIRDLGLQTDRCRQRADRHPRAARSRRPFWHRRNRGQGVCKVPAAGKSYGCPARESWFKLLPGGGRGYKCDAQAPRRFLRAHRSASAVAGRVSGRSMFGGVGLYRDGVFFGLTADERLFFRVNDETRPAYESAGMKCFQPWRTRSQAL